MKHQKTLTILLFSIIISFVACKDTSNSQKIEAPKSVEVSNSSTPTNAATPTNTSNAKAATPETSQNAKGIWHYTCSKGCAGGAGSAVNCTTCGNLLAHNQAYHGKPNSTPTSAPFMTQPTAQTGQNAAGVWHYTCGKGCAGGAGAAGNCSTCGEALAHNKAYH